MYKKMTQNFTQVTDALTLLLFKGSLGSYKRSPDDVMGLTTAVIKVSSYL